ITTLRKEIREDIPIIGLEPSCVTVFKDELLNLFPGDEDAKRLSKNVIFFSDFLVSKAADFTFPVLTDKILLHGHCHQKAVLKMSGDLSLLTKMKADFNHIESGCCGMAGAFCYE